MNLGRNDPCHCGSGKKYKHCHLDEDLKPDPETVYLQKHLEFIDGLMVKVHGHIEKKYPEETFYQALAEFSGLFGPIVESEDDDLEEALFTPEGQFFLSWYIYFWTPRTESEETEPHPQTPAASLLASGAPDLSATEKEYLEACLASALTYYEVTASSETDGVSLVDLFSGNAVVVKDASVAAQAQVGHLQFALVVPWQGRQLYDTLSPFDIGPEGKQKILDLKERFVGGGPFSPARLRELDLEMLKLHGDLTGEAGEGRPSGK